MSKITIGLIAATLLFVGCNNNANPSSNSGVGATVTEESLGLRKTDLYSEKSETQGDATHYSKSAAGSGYKIKRAFQDAPPMIPHDVEGMLPITINNNQCTGCHVPGVAESLGALPFPKSHMTNFRPKSIAISGANTSSANLKDISIKELSSLSGARFNCTQCHAPQSDSPAPKNTFEAAYVREDGASKSTWSGAKLMEGIDTIK
ncbi:nitrate reductase cytochrome c-type subunit [Sulfurimonas sp.]